MAWQHSLSGYFDTKSRQTKFTMMLSRDEFSDKNTEQHTAWVRSASGPICPFGDKVSKSKRFRDGWDFWNGSDWEVDNTLSSKCLRY